MYKVRLDTWYVGILNNWNRDLIDDLRGGIWKFVLSKETMTKL